MMTKSELTALIIRGLAHEAFTHETEGTFDITLMRAAAAAGLYGPVCCAQLRRRDVEFLMSARDWEESRVQELLSDPRRLWDTDPALAILTKDDKHMFCDGIHRIICRWRLGVPDFRFYLAPIDLAIRPDQSFVSIPGLDWGKVEIRGGKLYERGTNIPFKGQTPP